MSGRSQKGLTIAIRDRAKDRKMLSDLFSVSWWADYSDKKMQAILEVNLPSYASAMRRGVS